MRVFADRLSNESYENMFGETKEENEESCQGGVQSALFYDHRDVEKPVLDNCQPDD